MLNDLAAFEFGVLACSMNWLLFNLAFWHAQ
jgi:hypothetical protein